MLFHFKPIVPSVRVDFRDGRGALQQISYLIFSSVVLAIILNVVIHINHVSFLEPLRYNRIQVIKLQKRDVTISKLCR